MQHAVVKASVWAGVIEQYARSMEMTLVKALENVREAIALIKKNASKLHHHETLTIAV